MLLTAFGLLHAPLSMRAPPPRMDAFSWQQQLSESQTTLAELNLLPFSLDEALLPGETKQVHLFEARFLELFTEAEAKHSGCVGQLLITPGGNVAKITSLLEIEESRKQDIGVWARLRCVGRVELDDVEQTDFGYARAKVGLVTDKASDPVDEAVEECLQAHENCRSLEEKLRIKKAEASGGSGVKASDMASGPEKDALAEALNKLVDIQSSGSADARVEWGHEVPAVIGFESSLQTVRDKRRECLCFRGLDAPPASALDDNIQKLWGAESEKEAEAQLLSFSAAACLSTRERARALLETDTLERLQSATASFNEASRRLAAEVAIAGLGGGGGDGN